MEGRGRLLFGQVTIAPRYHLGRHPVSVGDVGDGVTSAQHARDREVAAERMRVVPRRPGARARRLQVAAEGISAVGAAAEWPLPLRPARYCKYQLQSARVQLGLPYPGLRHAQVEDAGIGIEVLGLSRQHLVGAPAVHREREDERALARVTLGFDLLVPPDRRDDYGQDVVVPIGPGELRRLLLEHEMHDRND